MASIAMKDRAPVFKDTSTLMNLFDIPGIGRLHADGVFTEGAVGRGSCVLTVWAYKAGDAPTRVAKVALNLQKDLPDGNDYLVINWDDNAAGEAVSGLVAGDEKQIDISFGTDIPASARYAEVEVDASGQIGNLVCNLDPSSQAVQWGGNGNGKATYQLQQLV
jgi:hypothetical protein